MELSRHDKKSLAKARQSAVNCGVPEVTRHILLCCDLDRASSPAASGSGQLGVPQNPAQAARAGRPGGRLPQQGGLLPHLRRRPDRGRLSRGSLVRAVRSAGIERIIQDHLIGGRPVEAYRIDGRAIADGEIHSLDGYERAMQDVERNEE